MNEVFQQSLLRDDQDHHLHPMTNPVHLRERGPEMVIGAKGVYLHTSDGRQVMDIGSGLSNVNIGYGDTRLCDAASEAMRKLSFGHTIYGRTNPWVAELSAKLAELTPAQYSRFLYGSTGSESIESAIKLALRYWRLRDKPTKRAVIARELSYHGNTLFAGGLTGLSQFHTQFGLPISDLIHHTASPYFYRDGNGRSVEEFTSDIVGQLEAVILQIGPDNIAAFVGDAIQTGGGSIMPPPGYWPEVRRLCDEYEIILIADEVISGFGKTGAMFAFEQFGFEPDLFVMAKGITSGYFPLSAIAIGEKVNAAFEAADEVFAHVFTNAGHPVGAAVALANIGVIEDEQLVDRVANQIDPALRSELEELREEFPFIDHVRSMGVIGAYEVDLSGGQGTTTPAESSAFFDRVTDIAWDKGLAIRGKGIFLPMTITDDELATGMRLLRESIAEAWKSR